MSQKTRPTYAQLRQQLDDVLVELQSEDVDIDKALAAYERGAALVSELEQYLEKAKVTITRLSSDDDTTGE